MKKILFILHLPPPVHGSSIVGQCVMKSTIINNSFDCRFINLLVSRTVGEAGKPRFLKIFRFMVALFKLLVEILKNKPDVCYLALTTTHAAFYKDVLIVALLRVFHIKRVYHLHNKGVSQNKIHKLNDLLYRFVFKNSDIILLSNQLYADIESFVPLSRVHICPNGIEDTVLNVKQDIFSDGKPVKILFLSNLITSKGIFELFDACSILQQKGVDFECNFVGAERDLNAMQFGERVCQYQLTSKVNYLGEKFGTEKEEIFATTDIFIHPTFEDCFPLVLLEAMKHSLPVVSTYEGGIVDIVDDGTTGFLVPQKNAEALADKLEQLIENPEMRIRMGNAGRLKYEREFTLEKFEQRLNNILQLIA